TWAELQKRLWPLDELEGPRCHQGRIRILAAIHSPGATQKILDCLGLPARALPLSPAVSEFAADVSFVGAALHARRSRLPSCRRKDYRRCDRHGCVYSP